jgi:hypothetical protein
MTLGDAVLFMVMFLSVGCLTSAFVFYDLWQAARREALEYREALERYAARRREDE